MVTRREFVLALSSFAGAWPTVRLNAAGRLPAAPFAEPPLPRFGYAAITWGSAVTQAMEDIAAVGFRGIQLRGEAFAQYGDKPAALRDALAQHRLTFAVLSSGN